ncbi:hypothetical protein [Sinomonas sp. ASV322]|uniref:hypothetical protein n=1 Tax=Sinomonas sp. ASV322 TaxID=3041920 RepID=UPI0027DB67AC|nr:hypothetical protein [Sinomonas sp. ASV322]MDQ4502611.1 hypothetical protein [Sinomonas sp. ASV322]
MKKRITALVVAATASVGLVMTAVPAQAYSSRLFQNAPSGCWGGVQWTGSSYYSGGLSYASTGERNNPCWLQGVSAAVTNNFIRPGEVVGPRYAGYWHVVSGFGASNPYNWSQFGGSHSFGNAWGNS